MTAPTDDYFTAERDSEGSIRLNRGRGALVALRHHSRRHVEVWLRQAVEEKWRRQYQAALDLLDREAAAAAKAGETA